MSLFRIENLNKASEEKLGELLWELSKTEIQEISDDFSTLVLDSLLNSIYEPNGLLSAQKIEIHLVRNSDINAYALPGNHLVINSGLIQFIDNEGELLGVLSHEVAHLELGHIRQKLIKELGLSLIISVTKNGGGPEVVRQISKVLSSTAFDRTMESAADKQAVKYLINAELNPKALSDVFLKLDEISPEMEYLSWMSTHPDLKSRSESIMNLIDVEYTSDRKILKSSTWKKFKELVN